jgi:hypothetical protein
MLIKDADHVYREQHIASYKSARLRTTFSTHVSQVCTPLTICSNDLDS